MPDGATHPTRQELSAFAQGRLAEAAAAAIASHLELCPACHKALEHLPPDPIVAKVGAAGPAGSSLLPGLAAPGNAAGSAGQPATPVSCPDLPRELAHHPKYVILRELGRGGMGVVYQARQKTMMNRQVVIKVIHRSLLDRPATLERFRREVEAAASLSHPNIVTAFDAEQAGELHMLVMEFVPGQSLAEVLDKKGPLPVANACHYMRQVASGLQHAHERGMVHRDIKPSNLMLMPKGQVKILDFGLAKVAFERGTGKGLTAVDAFMGTPDYSAPEQATDARTADIRADLYSLGCTLYCLLAGRPPFHQDTIVKTILAHIEKQPQPLPELRADVPEQLWAVVARLLAKQPEQRYQKPIEVVQALTPFAKPVANPNAKGDAAPALEVGSPGKGTRIDGDTSRIKKALRAVPGKAPPKEIPEKNEASPFKNLGKPSALPRKGKAASESGKPAPAGWYRRWPAMAGIGAGLLLALVAALWAGGVFKYGEEVEIADGGRKVLTARKERLPKPPGEDGAEARKGKSVDDAWMKQVAAMPAGKQVDAVAAKLKELNTGFDGKVTPEIKEGVVVGLNFNSDNVTDISPVGALTGLESLRCSGSVGDKGQLADLSPLKGMKLTLLECYCTRVSDLSPLEGMKLTYLHCGNSWVSDLSPLTGMGLRTLIVWNTGVSDLSPLKGMPLTDLGLPPSATDLSPLKGMPLKSLVCTFKPERDAEILRSVETLEKINGKPAKELLGTAQDVKEELLIVSKRTGNPEFFCMNDDGTGVRNLTNSKSANSHPAWSPDGRKIAFASDRDGVLNIYVMDHDGKNIKPLTSVRDPCWAPAWSPDGKKIAFCRTMNNGVFIFIMEADGRNVRRLTNQNAYYPAWSPDGKNILFASQPSGRGFHLFVVNADGTNPKELTKHDNKLGYAYPSWSPDGKKIAWSDHVGNALEVYTADADGKNAKRITKLGGMNRYPAWSSDGQRVVFHHSEGKAGILYVIGADGENLKSLLKDEAPVDGGRPEWRPSSERRLGSPGEDLPSALSPEARASRAFEKANKGAKDALLAGFDAALDKLAKSKRAVDQRLKMIDAVKEEKKRFEQDGLFPWSEPMWAHIAKYLATKNRAENNLRAVYKSRINAELKAKNNTKVEELRTELKNLTVPKVIAKWKYIIDGKYAGDHLLYSNRRIGNGDGPATWNLLKGVLILTFPDPKAPGGGWIDTLIISPDGTTISGTNQTKKPKLTGVYVK
jgi:Tol biopolymer transport system component/serine/threonine protein kinase